MRYENLPRKIQIPIYGIFVILFYSLLPLLTVHATDIEISSVENWNSGAMSGSRLVNSGLGIELDSGGSWGALTWKTPDKPLSVGAAFTSDGENIYVVRGLGDVLFWKYNGESDSWTTLQNMPRGAYFGSDIQYLNGNVYALFGGFQKAFGKYSVEDDSWSLLSDFPDHVFEDIS